MRPDRRLEPRPICFARVDEAGDPHAGEPPFTWPADSLNARMGTMPWPRILLVTEAAGLAELRLLDAAHEELTDNAFDSLVEAREAGRDWYSPWLGDWVAFPSDVSTLEEAQAHLSNLDAAEGA